jgi:hypothetical protein
MAAEAGRSPASNDEREIRALIERWSQAVRDQNMDGIRADHDPDILLFDVPLPLLSRGLDAYMASWEAFLSFGKAGRFRFSGHRDIGRLRCGVRHRGWQVRQHRFERQQRAARVSTDNGPAQS